MRRLDPILVVVGIRFAGPAFARLCPDRDQCYHDLEGCECLSPVSPDRRVDAALFFLFGCATCAGFAVPRNPRQSETSARPQKQPPAVQAAVVPTKPRATARHNGSSSRSWQPETPGAFLRRPGRIFRLTWLTRDCQAGTSGAPQEKEKSAAVTGRSGGLPAYTIGKHPDHG